MTTLGHHERLGKILWLSESLWTSFQAPVFLLTLRLNGFWLASHSAARRTLLIDQ